MCGCTAEVNHLPQQRFIRLKELYRWSSEDHSCTICTEHHAADSQMFIGVKRLQKKMRLRECRKGRQGSVVKA